MKEKENLLPSGTDREALSGEWKERRDRYYERLAALLAEYDGELVPFLAAAAAGTCGIPLDLLLHGKDSKRSGVRMARALFWYAYRHITNESYSRVAEVSKIIGLRYSADGIRKAVEEVSKQIWEKPWWKRRWIEMERVIEMITQKEQKQ